MRRRCRLALLGAVLSSTKAMLQSESARATAKIESAQHLEELRAQGALGLETTRATVVRARLYTPEAALEPGAKVVHLIRHGQGFHNLLGDLYRDFGRTVDSTGTDSGGPYARPEIVDPPLTAVGRDQAKALRPTTSALKTELVVCSPLQRAVETAALAFPSRENGVAWIAHPDAMEASGKNTCDMRRPRSEIHQNYPFLDLSLLESEVDDRWNPDARESAKSVSDRSHAFLLWLRRRAETHVAVATHSAWLFTLLNTAVVCDRDELKLWFLTGELRSLVLTYHDSP